MDFERADLKLYSKTNGYVLQNMWFLTKATRIVKVQNRISDATSLFISCPQLNAQYCLYYTIYICDMYVIDIEEGSAVKCNWPISHQPFYCWFENKMKENRHITNIFSISSSTCLFSTPGR